jgi:nucleoside-diphosphate-sugar epimerase
MGTAEEYGAIPPPFKESDPEQPTSNYGVSKLAATRASLAIEAATDMEVVVVRAGVAYGPGQPSDMFIASLITAMTSGTKFEMTSGEQTRDFIFVDDVVRGLVILATAAEASGQIFNIGSGFGMRVRYVAEFVETLTGAEGLLEIGAIASRAGEATDYWLDTSAIRNATGFEPAVPLHEGLAVTIAAHG